MRTKPWALALTFLIAIVMASPAHAEPGEDGSSQVPSGVLTSLESRIFKYAKDDRVDSGAAAFSESSSSDDMARAFSLMMVKSGIFSHDQPGFSYQDRLQEADLCQGACAAAAENIYQIDYPTMDAFLADVHTDDQVDKMAKDIVDGWLSSPENHHNIEDPLLESLGVGVAISTEGKLFVTAEFLRTTPLTDAQYRSFEGQPPAENPNRGNGGAEPPIASGVPPELQPAN